MFHNRILFFQIEDTYKVQKYKDLGNEQRNEPVFSGKSAVMLKIDTAYHVLTTSRKPQKEAVVAVGKHFLENMYVKCHFRVLRWHFGCIKWHIKNVKGRIIKEKSHTECPIGAAGETPAYHSSYSVPLCERH